MPFVLLYTARMKVGAATVFVVDDDVSARTGLSRLIRVAGYNVDAYADPAAFLADVTETPNACLVLDARMPGLGGGEVMAELASRGVRIPVIVVTADTDPETQKRARAMKATALFRKPVDGPALLDAIAWALGSPMDSRLRGEQQRKVHGDPFSHPDRRDGHDDQGD